MVSATIDVAKTLMITVDCPRGYSRCFLLSANGTSLGSSPLHYARRAYILAAAPQWGDIGLKPRVRQQLGRDGHSHRSAVQI